MRYDFSNAVILLPDGLPMPVSETDKSPFTATKALMTGLLADNQSNQNSKMERYELFLKVRSCALTYAVKEVALLREAALVFPTLIAGQLVYMLEQKDPSASAPPEIAPEIAPA